MKKILTAVLLITLASTSHARIFKESCFIIRQLAEDTMEARQTGVDKDKALAFSDGKRSEIDEWHRKLVLEAYSLPVNQNLTPEMQRKEIVEFAGRHYIDCLDTVIMSQMSAP